MEQKELNKINTLAIGNIYWLSNDLMWAIDAIYKNADKEIIIHGLNQSIHHLGKVLYGSKNYETQLYSLIELIKNKNNFEIDREYRINLIEEIVRIKNQIGALISFHQDDYNSGTPEKKIRG